MGRDVFRFERHPEIVSKFRENFHFDIIPCVFNIPGTIPVEQAEIEKQKFSKVSSWNVGHFPSVEMKKGTTKKKRIGAIADSLISILKKMEKDRNVPWDENTKEMYAVSIIANEYFCSSTNQLQTLFVIKASFE